MQSGKGSQFNSVSFWFDVVHKLPQLPANYFQQKELDFDNLAVKPQPQPISKNVQDNNLPEDFPEITINYANNPVENEYFFVSTHGFWGMFEDTEPYNIIFDNHGTPVYFQKLVGHGYDLRLQPNGNLSFFLNDWPAANHLEFDSSFQHIDTYLMGNGYGNTDFHELLLLPNEHAIVMCYDPQLVDMSQVVAGGHPNAIVSGWIIQELDADKNVIFQWRSWDHFEITDADEQVNLLDSNIDYTHGNSMELTDDNAMLLSPRNFNEVTKIDRNTGEIIWRMGGENNMFDFVNDTLRFSRGHDVRILENGNMSLFDNGTYHPEPQFSSVIEYAVDEENLEVTLVRRLRSDPDILGIIMGNAQETSQNDIVTGWGSGIPGITVFNIENEKTIEIYLEGINYRAYRSPWETNRFYTNSDSLNFGYMWYQEERINTIQIHNPQNHVLELTSFFNHNASFDLINEFPITIQPNDSIEIEVLFAPDSAGLYHDILTLNSDSIIQDYPKRIARQVHLMGHATQNQDISESTFQSWVSVYPNPFNKQLRIQLKEQKPDLLITLQDLSGRVIMQQNLSNSFSYILATPEIESGIYLISITDALTGKTSTFKIFKR